MTTTHNAARGEELAVIQQLQFTDRLEAERLLQQWFAEQMLLPTDSVTLTPKAVSLNSFHGFFSIDGMEFFFKTHVEEQGIVEEYSNVIPLMKAGYNIAEHVDLLQGRGQQMVIYPRVIWPTMFDLMRAVEMGNTEQADMALLVAAEKRECERILAIYRETLSMSSAQEHAKAPIHQLFWHRLTGGRLKSFYAGKRLPLPEQGDSEHAGLLFEDLLTYRWIINGVELSGPLPTLGQLLERARVVLDPTRAAMTVIGHGDAHFGNVFLQDRTRYQYFDPAFAGRHDPLLDIVKPLFHNVHATWMYFPHDVAQGLHCAITLRGDTIHVEHNYVLSPVRRALLQTKEEYLLRPLLAELHGKNALPENWQAILQSALFCCPLLTINLLDNKRIPPNVGWLGLTQAMQMGTYFANGMWP